MTVSLLNLRDNAKELADFTGQAFVPDTSWNVWANRGQERLWKMCAQTFQGAFESSTSFTLAGGIAGNSQLMSANARQLVHVVKDPTSVSTRRRIPRYNRGEAEAAVAISYRLIDKSVVFQPFAMCAGNYAIYWIAGPTALVADGDTLDPIFEAGAEYVETFMAIKALGKEESDSTDLRSDLKELGEDFMMLMANRDAAETDTINDVYAGLNSGGWPGWISSLP